MFQKAKSQPVHELSARKQRFYNFLKEYPVGVLSTVTPNGDPHGVVIYFDVNEHLDISFLTRAETRKRDNLKHSKHVALTVFEPKTQAVVQIAGEAKEITDSYEVNGLAQLILKASQKTSGAGAPPIAKLEAGPFVGYKITPKQGRMAVYARPETGEYSDLFEVVECFDLEHP